MDDDGGSVHPFRVRALARLALETTDRSIPPLSAQSAASSRWMSSVVAAMRSLAAFGS